MADFYHSRAVCKDQSNLNFADELVNIALNKPTKMSSIFTAHPAELANDGNTDGNFYLPQCACTAAHQYDDTWWTVDLGGLHHVFAVQIWNRADCCRE